MEISGPRVRCANCGMIYDRPPEENAFWIGAPLRVVGSEFCPNCGSNAANPVLGNSYIFTGNSTNARVAPVHSHVHRPRPTYAEWRAANLPKLLAMVAWAEERKPR